MALNIKDPECDRLARELARRTGETITEAVTKAILDRLKRETAYMAGTSAFVEEVMEISRRIAAMPRVNDLTEDEVLGYDEWGAPTR